MIKTLSMFSVLIALLCLSSCKKDTSPFPNNEMPYWLISYIEEIEDDPQYYGTQVYRYVWKGDYVYHIRIPISSCAYCELYDQFGVKLEFKDDKMWQNFHNNKKNKVLVWEWKENN